MADKSYRVLAEYVTLKVKDLAGTYVILGFYKGGIITGDVEPDSLEHHLDQGMLEEVHLDEDDLIGEDQEKQKPAAKKAASNS